MAKFQEMEYVDYAQWLKGTATRQEISEEVLSALDHLIPDEPKAQFVHPVKLKELQRVFAESVRMGAFV